MIELKITADNSADLMRQVMALAAGLATGGPVEVAEPEKPKATRSTKAKSEPAKQDTAEAGADNAASTEAESSSTSSTSTTATTGASPTEITEKDLRARATQYAAKAGPTALVEMQKLAGAENGKISEIVGDADRMQKLSALLEDAGF